MTNSNNNVNSNVVSNANVSEVIQNINFYTICFEISAWTAERTIAPEEMEQFAQQGIPTPVLDALRDKKLGKGKILTYDPDALKPFDAFRGRIRDKLRDLKSFPFMGGSYIFCDEAKYREALKFIEDQKPLYWQTYRSFEQNYDAVLANYIAQHPQHETIIRNKIIPKEIVLKTKFSYDYISFENILPAQGKEKFYEVVFNSLKENILKKAGEALRNAVGLRGVKSMIQRCIDVVSEFKPVKPVELGNLITEYKRILDSLDGIAVADRKKRFKQICEDLADSNWLDSAMSGKPTGTTAATAQESAPEQKADNTSTVQSPVQTGWQNSMW